MKSFCTPDDFAVASGMSLTRLLAELPSLSPTERREVALRLIEIDCSDAETEDLAACEQSAIAGFAMLETMEAGKSMP